jgi:hypothetical protein
LRFTLVALAVLLPSGAAAQASTREFWPELDVSYRPAKHQRTFLELASKSERDGPLHQGTVGLFQDYLWSSAAYLRGGYRFTFNTRGARYRESRLVGELVLPVASSKTLSLSNRLRGEARNIDRDWSYRIRDRLHLEHPSSASSGLRPTPYVTFEAYYDSRYNTIVRLAGRLGLETHLGGPAVLDVYYARQDDSRGSTRVVNAFGITLMLSY